MGSVLAFGADPRRQGRAGRSGVEQVEAADELPDAVGGRRELGLQGEGAGGRILADGPLQAVLQLLN